MWAEASPEPAVLGNWMLSLFCFVGTVTAVIMAWAHVKMATRKGQPAPESEWVTRGELRIEIQRVDQKLHSMQREQHNVSLQLVWMSGLLVQLCKKQDVPVPPSPSCNPGDEP